MGGSFKGGWAGSAGGWQRVISDQRSDIGDQEARRRVLSFEF
jgi:hypothetical protein